MVCFSETKMSDKEAMSLACEAAGLVRGWLEREDRVCQMVDGILNHQDQLDCVRVARRGEAERQFPDLEQRLEAKIDRRCLALARRLEDEEVTWLSESTERLARKTEGLKAKAFKALATDTNDFCSPPSKLLWVVESAEEVAAVAREVVQTSKVGLLRLSSLNPDAGDVAAADVKKMFILDDMDKLRLMRGAAFHLTEN